MTLDSAAEAILGELDARGETALFVAIDGDIAGVIGVRDAIRAEAHDVIHDLRHLKIKEIAILTGDREPAARAVARRVHADTVQAELLPADKARGSRSDSKPGTAWPWSATGSTMHRPWPRPTPASPWGASARTWPPRPAT